MNLCAEDIQAQPNLGYEDVRGEVDTFDSSIARIESAVAASCQAQVEWPARIAAGVTAVIDFLAENPAAARVLALDSRSAGPELDADYQEMIARFAALLAAGAPRSERLPASSDESVVAVIAAIVSCRIRTGTIDSLRDGDPDLIFLALLPYVGFAEASRWSTAVPC
jgi:hypothetical protein